MWCRSRSSIRYTQCTETQVQVVLPSLRRGKSEDRSSVCPQLQSALFRNWLLHYRGFSWGDVLRSASFVQKSLPAEGRKEHWIARKFHGGWGKLSNLNPWRSSHYPKQQGVAFLFWKWTVKGTVKTFLSTDWYKIEMHGARRSTSKKSNVSLEDFLALGIDIFQVEWPSKIDTNLEKSSDTLNSGEGGWGGALYDLFLSFLHAKHKFS